MLIVAGCVLVLVVGVGAVAAGIVNGWFGDPGPPIGFAVVANRPAVMVHVCGRATFRELAVSTVEGGAVGGEAGDPLWRIISPGLATREFRIGDAPRGWAQEMALSNPVLPKLIYVELEHSDGFVSEEILETRPAPPHGHVAYGGTVVSSQEFFGKLRSKQCDSMH